MIVENEAIEKSDKRTGSIFVLENNADIDIV